MPWISRHLRPVVKFVRICRVAPRMSWEQKLGQLLLIETIARVLITFNLRHCESEARHLFG